MMPDLTNASKGTDVRTGVVVALGLAIVVSVAAIIAKDTRHASAPGVTLSAKAPEMIRTAPAGNNVVVGVPGPGAVH